MSSASIQNTNPNGDALYKGLSSPMSTSVYMNFPKMANDMIVDNMHKGIPINTLGDIITKQMDDWVEKLRTRVRYNEKTGNKTPTKKILLNWIKACGVSEMDMLIQWNTNVHALLKLKRITHNEHFGIHNVTQPPTKSSAIR